MQYNAGKNLIRNLFNEVLGAPTVDISIIEKYVDPSYVQKVDGVTLNYEDFIQHMRKQKTIIASVSVEFLAIVEEGDTVFTNHIVTATKKDGSALKTKVIAQFTIQNNRLVGCDELTHLLAGSKEDRDMGSRH